MPCPLPIAYEDLAPTDAGAACGACRTEVIDRTRSDAAGACVRVVHDRFGRAWTVDDRSVRLVAWLARGRPELLRIAAGVLTRLRPERRPALRRFVGLVLARWRTGDRTSRAPREPQPDLPVRRG